MANPTRNAIEAAVALPAAASSDFDLNKDVFSRPKDLRPAAVLIGLVDRNSGPTVLLTKRSNRLNAHPGQIAFPGGKRDSHETLVQAALREAEEETGLNPNRSEILGVLPSHLTVTGFDVSPVVAWVTEPNPFTPNPGEVDEVFEVPLTHLLEVKNFRVEHRNWQGQKRFYYSVPFGPYYIWGATARILRGLADRF